MAPCNHRYVISYLPKQNRCPTKLNVRQSSCSTKHKSQSVDKIFIKNVKGFTFGACNLTKNSTLSQVFFIAFSSVAEQLFCGTPPSGCCCWKFHVFLETEIKTCRRLTDKLNIVSELPFPNFTLIPLPFHRHKIRSFPCWYICTSKYHIN